jgi:Tol biopolymer transport system component
MQLTNKITYTPDISPDGKQVASIYAINSAESQKIVIIPIEGGEATKTLDFSASTWTTIRWTPDGRSVAYIDNRGGAFNIWSQPIDSGPPKQLTDFKSDQIFSFEWSRDGKQLALARGTETSDVMLISDFR